MLHTRYILLVLFMLTPDTQAETIFSLKGLQQSGSSFFNTLKRNKLATTLALSGAAAFWMAYYRPHYFSTDYWKNYWSGAGGQRTTLSPVGSGSAPLAQEAGKAEGSKTAVGSKEEEKEEETAKQSVVRYTGSVCRPATKSKTQAPVETFDSLVAKSDEFFKDKPITIHNKIKNIAGNDLEKQKTIVEQAEKVRPIMHEQIVGLINTFLDYKLKHGSGKEKELYRTMTTGQFIDRLLTNRPLAFFGKKDSYLLRDRQTSGKSGLKDNRRLFESIGTDQEKPPLLLKDYLSYDEMAIAALLGVSVPTYFINNGYLYNAGKPGKDGTFQETGVYVGLVGARLEKPGLMNIVICL